MGLSAGTAGSGKPAGNCQRNSPARAVMAASMAPATKIVATRLAICFIETRGSSMPGGSRPFARERRGLARDAAALTYPRCKRRKRGTIDAARASAMLAHPSLHGCKQAGRELAIASKQREVGRLRLGQAIEAEVRMAPVFDGFGEVGFEVECVIVGIERFVVPAQPAVGVANVVPGLVVRRLQLRGVGEFLLRRGVGLFRLGSRFRFLALVGLMHRVSR